MFLSYLGWWSDDPKNDEQIFWVDSIYSMARNGCSNQSVVLINLEPGKLPTLCLKMWKERCVESFWVSLQCGALLIAKLRLTIWCQIDPDRSDYFKKIRGFNQQTYMWHHVTYSNIFGTPRPRHAKFILFLILIVPVLSGSPGKNRFYGDPSS